MLLRTVVLLLCASAGLCATLGLYNSQASDKDAAAVIDNAIDENERVAAADNSSAGEEPNLLNRILGVEKEPAEVDVPEGGAAPGTDSDGPAENAPAEEAPAQRRPSEGDGNEIGSVQTEESTAKPSTAEDKSSWGLSAIRGSFQTMHGFFDSLVELAGGRNGVCQYRCRHGDPPEPRPGYRLPEPNGCGSSLVGFQFDFGIPAMTTCCDRLDVCYDTCGTSKYDCDSGFRLCLHDICFNLKKSLGFVSKVQTCESMADALFGAVWTLGCRSYMNSQRAACVCRQEEKDEL